MLIRYRGYYMAVQRKFLFKVLKHEKRTFVSPSGHIMYYSIYLKNAN